MKQKPKPSSGKQPKKSAPDRDNRPKKIVTSLPVSFRMRSSDGKTDLACYRVEPAGKPVALFQIVHGMCEYFERYLPFARYLAGAGFLVFGNDHLGHGNSAATPGDLGFTASGGGAVFLAKDVYALTKKMREEYPDLPVILFGHSMGSFIVRDVLSRHARRFAGVIICGTGGPESPALLGKIAAKTIALFRGERHRSKLLRKVAFLGFNRKCGKHCRPAAWLSHDEQVVKKYEADPLCNFTFTVRAYDDLFTLVRQVNRPDWADHLPMALPVLVVSGEDDPVGGWGKGPRTVAERMALSGMTEITLRLYPGMRHEILNEIGKEKIWEDLLHWSHDQLPIT